MFTREEELWLIRYLLDDLPESDRESIEERYVVEEEWFEAVQALEVQLIRDYLLGGLTAEQRRMFEGKYLTVPDLRQRVFLTTALTNAANPASAVSVIARKTAEGTDMPLVEVGLQASPFPSERDPGLQRGIPKPPLSQRWWLL